MTQGFDSNDPWSNTPGFTLDGRSTVPYPDPDPQGTAEMWRAWKVDRTARRAASSAVPDEDAADDVFKNHEPPIITREAEEFDDPISALASWMKTAHANGWKLHEMSHAFCHAKGKMIKSGAKEGQFNPDREIETQWIKIEKSDVGRAVISYTIINGKTYSCYRSFNGLAGRSDAEMKEIVKA